MRGVSEATKGLRVLFYNHTADVSGAEISLLLTASALRQNVQVMLAAPEGELLQRARKQGLDVRVVPGYQARMSRNPLVMIRGIIGTYTTGRAFRQVIQELNPDIVHVNSIRAGLIASVAMKPGSPRRVWHVRDNLPDNLLGKVIRRVAAKRADRVIAISRAIASNFATTPRLRGKTNVVYDGVDVHQTAGSSIRSELDVSDQKFVLAVVGQITPWKRQHEAIAAFAQFAEQAPDSELWIVGAAKFREENEIYEKSLHQQVSVAGLQGRVRFLGFRSDVMNVMASIDVLVIPSENEPFGRVVIEAMLAGKPVIGTDGGGIPEIVVPGETGFLVPIGDVKGFCDKIRFFYEDESNRVTFGERGRARALKIFSLDHVSDEILDIYTSY